MQTPAKAGTTNIDSNPMHIGSEKITASPARLIQCDGRVGANLEASGSTADPTKHEKTRSRHSLKRVIMTPTGLQQHPETLANTAKTDLVVPLVVPLDAKTAELQRLIDAWPSLDGATKADIMQLVGAAKARGTR